MCENPETLEKKQGVDLDELEREAEKLLSLLKDRHPGIMTWNTSLLNRIKALNALTSSALGK